MKRNIDKLNKMIGLGAIDLDDFYTIDISKYSISLQGHFSSEKMKRYEKFSFHPDGNGYMTGRRRNVTIVLT